MNSQVAIIKELKGKNEELAEAKKKLLQELEKNGSQLQQLLKLSKAAANLVDSLSSSSPEVRESSLLCLSKVNEIITAEDAESVEESKNNVSMAIVANVGQSVKKTLSNPEKQITIIDLIPLEERIVKYLEFAEEKKIIPPTAQNSGWKLREQKHKKLFELIKNTLQNA